MNPWARLREAIAREPLFCAAFALLFIASLVPIWSPRLLPLLDLPNHLAAASIWRHFGDPSWGYDRFYRLNLLPVPYWGWALPVHLLSYVFAIETANKLFLSLYALALPLGAALLARQMGRSPWLALFAFPLVFNLSLQLGFVTFCAGLAILCFALWALDRFLEAPTRGRAVALLCLSCALYFAHVLPWLFFGVAAIALLFCHGLRPRRMAAAAGLMLPSVLLALWGLRAARHGRTAVEAGPLHVHASWMSTLDVLQRWPRSLIAAWPGDGAYRLLALLAVVWLAILLTARTDEADSEARRGGFPYRLEVCAGLATLMPFVLPAHLFRPVDLWNIGQRFVAVAALLLALLPHGPILGRRRLWLLPLVALAFAYPLTLAQHWRRFDQRAESVRRLALRIPRGKSTLTLVYGKGTDPDVDDEAVPWLMFHAYPQLWAGGFDAWALGNGFPMVKLDGRALPAPQWGHPETFDFETMGAKWDYLLTMNEIADDSVFGPDSAGRARLVGRDGSWRLYQIEPEP